MSGSDFLTLATILVLAVGVGLIVVSLVSKVIQKKKKANQPAEVKQDTPEEPSEEK